MWLRYLIKHTILELYQSVKTPIADILTMLGCFAGAITGGFLVISGLCSILFIYIDYEDGISIQDRQEASRGASQTFLLLEERMERLPIPQQTLLLSTYSTSNICCGQGESHSTWPIVTKLYESTLTKDEIRTFYGNYPEGIYFVDEIIAMYPDREVNIPCYPFNLLRGHSIPEELPQDKNLFIVTGSDSYTPSNPNILYCDP
jgi:hypothetical protein